MKESEGEGEREADLSTQLETTTVVALQHCC
jgi:hypothetical protein